MVNKLLANHISKLPSHHISSEMLVLESRGLRLPENLTLAEKSILCQPDVLRILASYDAKIRPP